MGVGVAVGKGVGVLVGTRVGVGVGVSVGVGVGISVGVGVAVGSGVGVLVGVGVGVFVGIGVGVSMIKSPLLVATPLPFCIVTLPVDAPLGTIAWIRVSAQEVMVAGISWKNTFDTPATNAPNL